MAQLEVSLVVANVLVEPRKKTSRDRLYLARKLVGARPGVPVRNMNVTNQFQVLHIGTTIGHAEQFTWAASVDNQEHQPRQTQGICVELKDVVFGARPNLNNK